MSPRAARAGATASLWTGAGSSRGQEGARFNRESDRRRLRAMARALMSASVLVALILGGLALRVQEIRLSYRLDQLRSTKVEFEEARSRLRVEVATLTSLARIEGVARGELGMVPPTREQVQLAREFVAGGTGVGMTTPLTAAADPRRRGESRAR